MATVRIRPRRTSPVALIVALPGLAAFGIAGLTVVRHALRMMGLI